VITAKPETVLQYQELLRRRNELAARVASKQRYRDVFADLGYEPNCKIRWDARNAGVPENQLPPMCGTCPQERFHATTAHAVLYGGAMGGGKTRALLMEGIRAAVRYPGIHIGAFRRSYPELEVSFFDELPKVDFARPVGARWLAGKNTLLFRNGSFIRFRYAETLDDVSRQQGSEYQLLLIDEAGLVLPGVIEYLEERQRTSNTGIPVLGVRLASNPGGHGHSALKARFIDPTGYGAHSVVDEQGRPTEFIPAKYLDNFHLNASYLAQLTAIKDPARRAAMKDGNWDVFIGQVFEEWDHDRHVVPRTTLPPTWERWAGIDYGRSAPWAVLWFAVDGDHRIWLYREAYETGVGVRDQARRILALEREAGETYVRHAIDPSTMNHLTDGLSIYEEYAQEGLPCIAAGHDRLAGWAKLHDALSDGPICRVHEYLRQQGKWHQDSCPMLHVLDGTCPNLVRTLPDLPYDKTKVEDVDSKVEDHAADALRYALQMMGGVGSPFAREPERPKPTTKPLTLTPGVGTAVSPFAGNGHDGNGSHA
jgi:hypothetical protein